MAEQSFLAKLGLRLGILGSSASLAIAAPLAAGDYSVSAATSVSRIGVYFDRSAGVEKIGFVVMGTEVLSAGVTGISSPFAINGLMAANSIKGNNTGGPLTSFDLTTTQVIAMLPSFMASGASHARGIVPDPGASPGSTRFLCEDATWAVPGGGGGGVTSVNSQTGVVFLTASDVGAITDAPIDGSTYGRQNGTWVVSGGGSPFTPILEVYNAAAGFVAPALNNVNDPTNRTFSTCTETSFSAIPSTAEFVCAGPLATGPIFLFAGAKGSIAFPTALLDGDTITSFNFQGFNGFDWLNTGGSFQVSAYGNWSGSAAGVQYAWNANRQGEVSGIGAMQLRGTLTDPSLVLSIGLLAGHTPGNGLLQLRSGATKAYGIAFGTDVFVYRNDSTSIAIEGNVKLPVVGRGIYIKEGSNATMGTAVLSGGTVVVSTNKVTANSRIFLTANTPGGTLGAVYVSARSAGTSFTITSISVIDTSTIAWIIIEPS